MKRHLAGLLAGATGLLLAITACGNGGDAPKTSDGKQVLTIALWNYDTTPEFKTLIEGFEKANPTIDVQPVDIPAGEDYAKKLTTMLAGGDQTDVLTMKNVTDYSRYATRGQLAPVDDLLEGVDKNSYFGLDAYNLDGKYYAVPYRQDFWVLYYNKKLLASAGADLSNLTWDEYAQLAKKLTTGSGANKVYGTYHHTWRSVIQATAAAQNNGDLISGDYGFMAKQYTMALDLEKAGAALPWATANSQKVDYNSQFSLEKTALLPMGTWYAARLITDKAAGKHNVDWGFAPMPQVANGPVTSFGSPTAFAVNKKARNAEAARTFVKWASGEQGATAIAKIGVFPSFHNEAVLTAYSSVQGMPSDDVAKKALKPDTVALEMPVSEKSSDVDAILTEEHQLIMSGNKSVADGIKEMESRVKSEVG